MIKFKFVLAEQTSIYHPRVMKNEFVVRDNRYLGSSLPSSFFPPRIKHFEYAFPEQERRIGSVCNVFINFINFPIFGGEK